MIYPIKLWLEYAFKIPRDDGGLGTFTPKMATLKALSSL